MNPANARLIAAAPDLLAALRAVKATLEQPVFNTTTREPSTCDILRGDAAHAWELARQAIARAETATPD